VAGVYDRQRYGGGDNGLLASWDGGPCPRSPTSCGSPSITRAGRTPTAPPASRASWAFAKNVSVILGYAHLTQQDRAGQNTATSRSTSNFP